MVIIELLLHQQLLPVRLEGFKLFVLVSEGAPQIFIELIGLDVFNICPKPIIHGLVLVKLSYLFLLFLWYFFLFLFFRYVEHSCPTLLEDCVLIVLVLVIATLHLERREDTEGLAVSRENASQESAVFRREFELVSCPVFSVVNLQGFLDLLFNFIALFEVFKIKVVRKALRTLSLVVKFNQLVALEFGEKPLGLSHACLGVEGGIVSVLQDKHEVLRAVKLPLNLLCKLEILSVDVEGPIDKRSQPVEALQIWDFVVEGPQVENLDETEVTKRLLCCLSSPNHLFRNLLDRFFFQTRALAVFGFKLLHEISRENLLLPNFGLTILFRVTLFGLTILARVTLLLGITLVTLTSRSFVFVTIVQFISLLVVSFVLEEVVYNYLPACVLFWILGPFLGSVKAGTSLAEPFIISACPL